nr:MAG TPA: hypothetical protein [Caudoviricetes sp.]
MIHFDLKYLHTVISGIPPLVSDIGCRFLVYHWCRSLIL